MSDETSKVETYLQFNGPVDTSKNQYREFRVREDDLASISTSERVVNDITDGLKNVTDKHNQEINDLKKQIRELEKLNTLWNSLKKISSKEGKRLIMRILQSDEKIIKQFETDNFQNNDSWTRIKKATSGVDFKEALSTINIIDSDGSVVGKYLEPIIPTGETEVMSKVEVSQENVPPQVIDTGSNEIDQALETKQLEATPEPMNEEKDEEPEIQTIAEEKEIVTQGNSSQPSVEKKEEPKPDPIMDYVKENGEEYVRRHMEREKERETLQELNRKEVETKADVSPSNIVEKDAETPKNEQNLKEKLGEKLERKVQSDDDSDGLSSEEREERRKLAVVEKIAELKCFLDAEMNTVIYNQDSIKNLVRTVVETRNQVNAEHKYDENNSEDSELIHLSVEDDNEDEDDDCVEQEETEKQKDVGYDNAQSEKSYETTTTSTNADSENTFIDPWVKTIATNTARKPAPAANKKKGKKGKKPKKNKNAPKITMEEVEAIRKLKKEKHDRAFKMRDDEIRERQAKVEASERHKLYRRAAETALEMDLAGNMDLPIEIEKLNSNLEFHVNITTDSERIRLREIYFRERVKEVTNSFVGSVLACKMQYLMTFRSHIHRSQHLFKYFMFLVSLDESGDDFYEFECMTLEYFCRGYEEHVRPTEGSTPLQLAFYYFDMDVISSIPETDQFINAVTIVRNKLILLEEMSEMMQLTDNEKTMRDTYFSIGQFLKEYRHVTNATSFLQANKAEPKFDLMEEWFFASKKPRQYLSVPTPESC